MTATDVRVVLVTVPDAETGRGLARSLVEERLAACGNVLPGVTSVFRWEDDVQIDSEALLILKTSADRVERMMERARVLHPYEVPELLALPVVAGDQAYAAWVLSETRSA